MPVSIIVPAYNEEKRITPFLEELLKFRKKNKYIKEIIIVNDGSTDRTLEIVRKFKGIKILSHKKNKGKGAAVKTGTLATKYEFIIFMDADGSIHPNEIPKMVNALKKYPVGIGARNAKKSKIIVKQPLRRFIAGKIFNRIVNMLFPLNIYDTLCGFKGMRKKQGKEIASDLVSKDWMFDVEILARAKNYGYKIAVIPIEWKDVRGSKMRLGWTSLKMLYNLIKLRMII